MTCAATRHQEDSQSDVTSLPFLSKMIAKLEMTPRAAQQYKDQTRNPHKRWDESTTTETPATEATGGLKCIFTCANVHPIFCCC